MNARKTTTAVALAALLAWLPAEAEAQQGNFFVEGRGGIGLGLGDVSELTEPGPTFGLELGYWLDDRLAVTVGGDATLFQGEDQDPSEGIAIDVPDIRMFHYTAGLQVRATPHDNPFAVRFGGGVGATTIDTDQFPAAFLAGLPLGVEPPEDGEFHTTEPTFQGNLSVGYDVSPRFSIFAGTRPYVALTDRQETQFFHEAVAAVDVRGFNTAWDLPVHAGVRVDF